MKIKVCGLKYKDNIDDVVSLVPDYIGLIFYPASKRYAGNEKGLAEYVRSIKTVQKAGVFVNASAEDVLHTAKKYALDVVQLHGNETPAVCTAINNKIKAIKVFGIHTRFDFDRLYDYEYACDGYLFDTYSPQHGGSGRPFDWSLLDNKDIPRNFLLSGGISLDNIQQIKYVTHPALEGIDVNSCFEIQPGLKDIHKLKTLFNDIRS